MRVFVVLCFAGCFVGVDAHGSMILPLARNSIDAETPAWSGGKHPMTGTIEPYNCQYVFCVMIATFKHFVCARACVFNNSYQPDHANVSESCTNGTDVCNNGQSCFWFSNGCTPGCKACDGNGNRYPNFDHCPNENKNLKPSDYLLKKYWTGDKTWPEGTSYDIFKFNPVSTPAV